MMMQSLFTVNSIVKVAVRLPSSSIRYQRPITAGVTATTASCSCCNNFSTNIHRLEELSMQKHQHHHHHHQQQPIRLKNYLSFSNVSDEGNRQHQRVQKRHFASEPVTLKESYEYIKVDITSHPGVGLITLHRPKALNALCDDLFVDLIHAATALDQNNDSIGCLVLTGSTKAFAAGADISEMKDRTFEYAYSKNMFHEWGNITKVSKPIIAAVNGFCLGGGCELAMMCDMIIASDTAKFGQPEINLGIIPGAGGTQRLTRAIGKSKSMYMCLTGDIMDAEWAERAGLVAKVVPSDELLTETIKIATKIASKGRMSVMMAKEAMNASQDLSLQEGLRFERRLFHSLFATHDQKEGMTAFLEKRPPNFSHSK